MAILSKDTRENKDDTRENKVRGGMRNMRKKLIAILLITGAALTSCSSKSQPQTTVIPTQVTTEITTEATTETLGYSILKTSSEIKGHELIDAAKYEALGIISAENPGAKFINIEIIQYDYIASLNYPDTNSVITYTIDGLQDSSRKMLTNLEKWSETYGDGHPLAKSWHEKYALGYAMSYFEIEDENEISSWEFNTEQGYNSIIYKVNLKMKSGEEKYAEFENPSYLH